MSEPKEPKPWQGSQRVVRDGLGIFADRAGHVFGVNVRPFVQDAIDEFVRANVAESPVSASGLLQELGLMKKEKR